ncbi:MAG: SigE family RNA polymerase sigma factor [Actinomycetota bacterium]|nr:SigE family RNA polymerase sigma factor [Actinomycetota bacterium]
MTPSGIGDRIADALWAACHPLPVVGASVGGVQSTAGALMAEVVAPGVPVTTAAPAVTAADVDRLVVDLFEREGRSLVRLARLFVDDRNAAEDLVQEAFIRLARSADRIKDERKAAAYLRSIVLNLARDHNRRGLVSLRHRLPFDDFRASTEDEISLRDDQRLVIEALRELPHRQRDCLVLRYYQELGVDDIAETLGISRNSVKTHLKRGLAAMQSRVAQLERGGGE